MSADRHNSGKTEMSLLPLDCLAEVAKVLMKGRDKYSRDNWRKGQPINQILDSLLRHVAQLQKGEERDSESGELHSAHIATNALFLIWEDLRNKNLNFNSSLEDLRGLDLFKLKRHDICILRNGIRILVLGMDDYYLVARKLGSTKGFEEVHLPVEAIARDPSFDVMAVLNV